MVVPQAVDVCAVQELSCFGVIERKLAFVGYHVTGQC